MRNYETRCKKESTKMTNFTSPKKIEKKGKRKNQFLLPLFLETQSLTPTPLFSPFRRKHNDSRRRHHTHPNGSRLHGTQPHTHHLSIPRPSHPRHRSRTFDDAIPSTGTLRRQDGLGDRYESGYLVVGLYALCVSCG